ncbi:Protein angel 2 [Linnemannia zychae]|nr:Protein angel 2 [Linnemannia zychae]
MFRLLRRNWSSPPHERYDTFTVMTYNLLSSTLALQNQHLYRHCAQGVIEWRDRSKRLLQELRSQLLDIYCLQEIDKEDYISLFQPTFREWGYSGVYKKRNGSKTDGCAIFFRNRTVKAIRLHGVNYDDNSFSKKENIGIVGIFDIKHRNKTTRICLATTHIIFHPTYGMTKVAQLRILLDSARKMIVEQKADIPIVLCGDFNALPYSTVVRYLTDECVDVSDNNSDYKQRRFNNHYNANSRKHDSYYSHSLERNRHRDANPTLRGGVERFKSTVTYQEIKGRMG